MSMKSFNRLLGLSTIDARIHEALQQGRWDDLLPEAQTNPDLVLTLKQLKADSFDEYLRAALAVVEQAEAPDPAPFPESTCGLSRAKSLRGAKRVA